MTIAEQFLERGRKFNGTDTYEKKPEELATLLDEIRSAGQEHYFSEWHGNNGVVTFSDGSRIAWSDTCGFEIALMTAEELERLKASDAKLDKGLMGHEREQP